MSNVTTSVIVAAESAGLLIEAEALAERLGLPCALLSDLNEGICLVRTVARLELRQLGKGAPGAVFVDFVGGAVGHRRRFGGGRGQLAAKAVGIKKDSIPYVVDATAGLGRDAFILAQLGCRVEMVERSPVVAALLADGLRRAAEDDEVAPIVERMHLNVGNAADWLGALAEKDRPDVVYVDPMHPERSKSALVKKEMRLFRELVGADGDDAELLAAALQAAKKRVVVKRQKKSAAIDGPKPGLVMEGKSTRYDVYLRNNNGITH